MQNQKVLITGILVATFALVIGFAFGRHSFRTGRFMEFDRRMAMVGQFGKGGMMGGRGFGDRDGFGRGALSGEITNISGDKITLKLTNGNKVEVNLDKMTNYTQVNQLQQTDLKVGLKVQIFGAKASDGSVVARGVRVGEVIK